MPTYNEEDKNKFKPVSLAELANQSEWQTNRNNIIANMGTPVEPSWQDKRNAIISNMGNPNQPTWQDNRDKIIANMGTQNQLSWQDNRDSIIANMGSKLQQNDTSYSKEDKNTLQPISTDALATQSEWQNNRDRIIERMGQPIQQDNRPVQMNMGFMPENYTQEQANSARQFNEGLKNQAQTKGSFTPGYMTGNTIDLREQSVTKPKETLDANNLFGYQSNENKTGFQQWTDRNVQKNLSNMGDPNSFNSIGTSSSLSKNNVQLPDNKTYPSHSTNTSSNQSVKQPTSETMKQNSTLPDMSGWQDWEKNRYMYHIGQGVKWDRDAYKAMEASKNQQPSTNQQSQPQTLKVISKTTEQPRTVEEIRGTQLTNTQFAGETPSGISVRRVYDAQGKEMSRADQEQMENMRIARSLALQASRPDTRSPQKVIVGYTEPQAIRNRNGSTQLVGGGEPIYQMVNPTGESSGQAAARALQGFGGLVGTIPGYQRDMATANKANVDASLAPGLAQSEIGLRGAQANKYNTDNQYAQKEFGLKKIAAESQANYHNAMAERALKENPNNNIEQQRLNLDRQKAAAKEYDMIVGNSPNMPEPQKNKLKRELEVKYGLRQRRSATEF